jgi:transcriptional regulator with XRE-family HTH domain
VDDRTEARGFLRSRRARIAPEQVNLVGGRSRRVPGLRRDEVALLAGVSVDYYAQLERGDLGGASEEVLQAIARALRLDDAETAHLFDLARAAQPSAARRRSPNPGAKAVRPNLQRFVDAVDAPVWIRNDRMDFLATNRLGRALFSPIFALGDRPANNARFVFLHEVESRDFYVDWEQKARDIVATLRGYAGQRPQDRGLRDLIGELATNSRVFSELWAKHDVRFHHAGAKRIHHPVVGDLELSYEAFDLSSDPGWHMFAYAAEPGSASDERLSLLASWAATTEQETQA